MQFDMENVCICAVHTLGEVETTALMISRFSKVENSRNTCAGISSPKVEDYYFASFTSSFYQLEHGY